MRFKSVCSLCLCLIVAAFLPACKNTPTALISAADQFANKTAGPDYLGYVAADPLLTPEQKQLRTINVETFRQAVAAAKAGGTSTGLFGTGLFGGSAAPPASPGMLPDDPLLRPPPLWRTPAVR